MIQMKTTQNTRAGLWLMIATTFVFAMQDGISRHLGSSNSIIMVVMLRFWFFAAIVIAIAARSPQGFRAAIATKHLGIQLLRGPLLAFEVCVMVLAFVKLGLIESHAVFTSAPLLVAALSGPILGERVGWRRWVAIGVGFLGVLVILQPGVSVFSPWALVPLLAAFLFALYALLTRSVARGDSASVSFFWTGVTGAVAMTPFGLYAMHPMSLPDWGWMAALCCTAMLGHNLFIRAYAVAEASAVQPFAYFQLPFASMLAIVAFGEELKLHVILGAAIVVSAGLFTLWRQRVNERRASAPSVPK
jgi:drug/metabolite transporter (DMT)-like permease